MCSREYKSFLEAANQELRIRIFVAGVERFILERFSFSFFTAESMNKTEILLLDQRELSLISYRN
jgi:hypothetical protein